MDFGKVLVGLGAIGVGLASFSTSTIFGGLVALAGVYLLGNGVKE